MAAYGLVEARVLEQMLCNCSLGTVPIVRSGKNSLYNLRQQYNHT